MSPDCDPGTSVPDEVASLIVDERNGGALVKYSNRQPREFFASAKAAPCCGEPEGCGRKPKFIVVCLADSGGGFEQLPTVTIYAACKRHQSAAMALAWSEAATGEMPQLLPVGDLASVVDQFHRGKWRGTADGLSVLTNIGGN